MTEKNDKQIVLTPSQQQAFNKLKNFVNGSSAITFILTGYAGTGKTTLMKTLIEWINEQNKEFQLLASTGRAAKILSNKTECEAKTVHSCIYTFDDFNQDIEKVVNRIDDSKGIDDTGQLLLQFTSVSAKNSDYDRKIYIIDEASMISDFPDKNPTQAIFGTGRLLHDLINYDYKGCFIFVGDACQLPPIAQEFSPALDKEYLVDVHRMNVERATLNEIVRQQDGNDIVVAAARMRALYQNPPHVKWGKFPFRGYKDIEIHPNKLSILNAYINNVKQNGFEDATLLCGSNAACNTLTSIVRPALGFHSLSLEVGELLLITQNNNTTRLMNGDLVKVISTERRIRRAGLTFLQVEVEEMVSKQTFSLLLIEDILYGNMTNLTQESQKALFIDFYRRMKKQHIKPKTDAFKAAMFNDPYLNALRAVYGYALTCHKAQGGEWKNVYLDIPRHLSHSPKRSAYQWLYTAMTRASNRLHVADDFFIG